MKEYLLSTNNYLEPAVLKDADAYAILLTRLLLLDPGTNPLHPGMGVGLGPKYRYISENDLAPLQSLIQNQVNTYLPTDFLNNTKVYITLKENSKFLIITIIANGTKYLFDTENSSTPIELSDLISN